MSIHQSDPDARPDEEFEAGEPAHLVVGSAGRLLDARRTPIRIVDLDDRTGQFTVEICAFEDAGTRWMLPHEDVGRFQFEKNGPTNSAGRVREIEAIIERLDRPMTIPCDEDARADTQRRVEADMQQVRRWLRAHSTFLAEAGELPDPEQRAGDVRLLDDLARFLKERDLWDIEDAFATTFVSAPFGELIKGHRIVIAEMGLVPYEGKIIRDETMFDEPWTRPRRAAHIIARLAFIRALAGELGIDHFTLYRGVSSAGPIRGPRNETFISATFSRAVAESLAGAHGPDGTGRLMRQAVPVERIFMTYLETIHMNRQYREAEAILLFDEGNPRF
jgi:hypothetical protein